MFCAKSLEEGDHLRARYDLLKDGDGQQAVTVPHELEGLPPEWRERLRDELIDQLLDGARTQEEIVGPGGVLAQLTKRLVERAMDAELSDHLG